MTEHTLIRKQQHEQRTTSVRFPLYIKRCNRDISIHNGDCKCNISIDLTKKKSFKTMSYRPSSARRQQTSINPITGEKIDYNKKAHFIKDQTTPMYVNILNLLNFNYNNSLISSSIPTLDLSDVNDSDRRPPPSAKQYQGSSR